MSATPLLMSPICMNVILQESIVMILQLKAKYSLAHDQKNDYYRLSLTFDI